MIFIRIPVHEFGICNLSLDLFTHALQTRGISVLNGYNVSNYDRKEKKEIMMR